MIKSQLEESTWLIGNWQMSRFQDVFRIAMLPEQKLLSLFCIMIYRSHTIDSPAAEYLLSHGKTHKLCSVHSMIIITNCKESCLSQCTYEAFILCVIFEPPFLRLVSMVQLVKVMSFRY